MAGFGDLGVPAVLNGVGPATRLGGLPLHPEVWEAMRESLRSPVRMDVLERAAGERIADLLGVPGAYVTAGASAALLLAAAVCIAADEPAAVDQLPDTSGRRGTVVIQKAHRDPYDRAVTATGANLREIGYPESTHPDELERALDSEVAAVLYRPGRPGNLLGLADTAHIAHRFGVPVIVDGALYAPPVERLHQFFADGADLVAVSGGKGFRGPQASGLLLGRADLVAAVGAHHQDLDERAQTWPVRPAATPSRHGIARPAKVGREQIAGLLAAIERYLRSPGADDGPGIAELEQLEAILAARSLVVQRVHDDALDVPTLRLEVGDQARTDALVRALAKRPVPVYLGESEAWRGTVRVNPMALGNGHGEAIGAAIIEELAKLDA